MGPGARAIASLLAGVLLPLAAAGGEVALSFGDAPGGAARGFRIERRAAGAVKFEPARAGRARRRPSSSTAGSRTGNRYCYRVRSLMPEAATWSPEVCAVAEPEVAEPEPTPSVAAPEASQADAGAPAAVRRGRRAPRRRLRSLRRRALRGASARAAAGSRCSTEPAGRAPSAATALGSDRAQRPSNIR